MERSIWATNNLSIPKQSSKDFKLSHKTPKAKVPRSSATGPLLYNSSIAHLMSLQTRTKARPPHERVPQHSTTQTPISQQPAQNGTSQRHHLTITSQLQPIQRLPISQRTHKSASMTSGHGDRATREGVLASLTPRAEDLATRLRSQYLTPNGMNGIVGLPRPDRIILPGSSSSEVVARKECRRWVPEPEPK